MMACRMLIAVGSFQVEHLFRDFKLMAMSKNEKHENNENDPYVHDDGWGVALGKSGKLTELYKKDVPCWRDPNFQRYYGVGADFVIAHARRATDKNFVDLTYTHPFERKGWYFCHNGTVIEPKAKEKRDSEQFFELLLSNIQAQNDVRESIENTVNEIKDYTALNFILANRDFAYILTKHKTKPLYYTMKFSKNKEYIIVSSESLPHFGGQWETISNNSLIEVDIAHRTMAVRTLNVS
jgi:predicted glutamine amidotransferase